MHYTVRAGDTLSRIARNHEIAMEMLLALNPSYRANPNRLGVGAVLILPDSAPDGKRSPLQKGAAKVATKAAAVAVAAATAAAVAGATAWVLGQLSSRYETGGRGPGTVSSGSGDAGGVSYGSYQMTSIPRGGTVARFVNDPEFPFRERFAGLEPGSAAFTSAWKALAAKQREAFHAAQHDFIRRTHFDPMVRLLKEATGIDITTRSPALQDCCWSTAVQHGPGNPIVRGVCAALKAAGTPRPEDGNAYDEAVIHAIYAERGRRRADGNLAHFGRNSPEVQAGVAGRFEREERDALAMLRKSSVG